MQLADGPEKLNPTQKMFLLESPHSRESTGLICFHLIVQVEASMSTVENLYFFFVGTTERLLSLITAPLVYRSVDPCIYYMRERINSFPIYKKRAEMTTEPMVSS